MTNRNHEQREMHEQAMTTKATTTTRVPSFRLQVANLRRACGLRPRRRGLTLVEMLVSLVCVMLLMMAYTQLFSDVGSKVGEARSMINLNSRLRSAAQRLRTDLQSHTCDMTVWQRPESGSGYFEIIEGPLCDKTPWADANSSTPTNIHNGLMAADYTTAGGAFNKTSGVAPNTDESIEHYPLGDTDDVLMLTVRSRDAPFRGQYAGTSVQAETAEVVWFLRPTMKSDGASPPKFTLTDPPTYTLYRRVFLVAPTSTQVLQTTYDPAPQTYDVSMHLDNTIVPPTYVPNSLGDLTKRENRFAHVWLPTATDPTNGFPHTVDPTKLVPFGGKLQTVVANPQNSYKIDPTLASYARYGEDVVLTNVLSFDVQVWDPTAHVKLAGTAPNQIAVTPGDPAFKSITPAATDAQGAFVDLAYDTTLMTPNNSTFSGPGTSNSTETTVQLVATTPTGLPTPYFKTWLFDDGKVSAAVPLPNYSTFSQTPATYDTWSFSYETDGLNQDGIGGPDQGTDPIAGMTGGGGSGYETSPPYPVPLRGIRIRIRCYEPDARDVREVTVTESFVPE